MIEGKMCTIPVRLRSIYDVSRKIVLRGQENDHRQTEISLV